MLPDGLCFLMVIGGTGMARVDTGDLGYPCHL